MHEIHSTKTPFILQIAALVLLCFAAGCDTGYRAQPMDLPTDALQDAVTAAANDPQIAYTELLPDEWWTLFHDDQLTTFIETAFDRNPSLKEAKANILLAYYNADRVRATLYPNINWGADILREKFSQTGIIPFNTTGQLTGQPPPVAQGGLSGIPVYFTQYETEFILTYDFDLWGKNRSTLKAALGNVQANIADEIFTRLQLGIAVAQAYFKLQIYYKRLEIAQGKVSAAEKLADLSRQRVSGNLDSNLTENSAEVVLAQMMQALYEIQGNIAVTEYQLKTYLAGNFQEIIDSIPIVEQPLPKVPLPADIPFHLIAHRPDVISQLWVIESAGHQIDAAKAGFYPDFSLTALFGYQTIHPGDLFKWPSSFYSVDPAVVLPFFDGGRLRANLHGSQVNYDLAIYEYNRLVLNAVKEVLDGIAVLRSSEMQLGQYKKIAAKNEQNYQLTLLRTNNNLSSDLDLLNTQIKFLAAHDQEVIALGTTIQSILSLIKALGVGYEACYE
jgi:NodT family efflux transporter outer membrane factor (OMF) lipoprotein